MKILERILSLFGGGSVGIVLSIFAVSLSRAGLLPLSLFLVVPTLFFGSILTSFFVHKPFFAKGAFFLEFMLSDGDGGMAEDNTWKEALTDLALKFGYFFAWLGLLGVSFLMKPGTRQVLVLLPFFVILLLPLLFKGPPATDEAS